jgi:hypothetical protein
MLKRLLAFLTRYFLWLGLAVMATLGSLLLVMLFADWDFGSLVASGLAFPALSLAAILGVPMAMLGLGRIFFLTSLGGGLLYSVVAVLG